MFDAKVEQAMLERLHACEAELQGAEYKMEEVRRVVQEKEQKVAAWQSSIDDYRCAYDLPVQLDVSPVLSAEYSTMGPTELIRYWAAKHDGDVVVKDLARAAVSAGVFTSTRQASSNIYAVLRRKGYEKVGPGHYRQLSTQPAIFVRPSNGRKG